MAILRDLTAVGKWLANRAPFDGFKIRWQIWIANNEPVDWGQNSLLWNHWGRNENGFREGQENHEISHRSLLKGKGLQRAPDWFDFRQPTSLNKKLWFFDMLFLISKPFRKRMLECVSCEIALYDYVYCEVTTIHVILHIGFEYLFSL